MLCIGTHTHTCLQLHPDQLVYGTGSWHVGVCYPVDHVCVKTGQRKSRRDVWGLSARPSIRLIAGPPKLDAVVAIYVGPGDPDNCLALFVQPGPHIMPTHADFERLRRKVETELSEQTSYSPVPWPDDMFSVNFKNGGSVLVARCDAVNLVMFSCAQDIQGNKFEVSAQPIPGKTEHSVKFTKLGVLGQDGVYRRLKLEGTACVRITKNKPSGEYRYESYTFYIETCDITFKVIKHIACDA